MAEAERQSGVKQRLSIQLEQDKMKEEARREEVNIAPLTKPPIQHNYFATKLPFFFKKKINQ